MATIYNYFFLSIHSRFLHLNLFSMSLFVVQFGL